jgi:hypothetical protein
VSLENDGCIPVRAMVRGDGTDLFGVMFNDGVDVAVDYSEMRRNGGRLTMSSGLVFSRLNEMLGLSLSLKSILADSLVANVQQATAVVPVRRGRLDLGMADGCELVSVKYLPEEVRVTAFVDELPAIKEVVAPAIVQDGVQCDKAATCSTLPLWAGLDKVIEDYLGDITLEDVITGNRRKMLKDYCGSCEN